MAYRTGLGYYVAGVAKAHANGDVDTFTVTGLVLVNLIYGVCTVAPGGAVNLNVGNNPTGGAPPATIAFCAAGAVTGATAGDPITIDLVGGALTVALTGASAAYRLLAQGGTIFVRGTAVQGTSQWFCYYIPLTVGSTVVAIP